MYVFNFYLIKYLNCENGLTYIYREFRINEIIL